MSRRSSTRGVNGRLNRESDKKLKKKTSSNAFMRKMIAKKVLVKKKQQQQQPVKRKSSGSVGWTGDGNTDDEAVATPRMNHGTKYCTDVVQIQAAASKIEPFVHRTPVMTSSLLDAMFSANGNLVGASEATKRRRSLREGHLFFKCELFQKTGSFKVRGALNAVMSLSEDEAAKGVITHSSGNHAQAVALAAKMQHIPAYIVMPRDAPANKVSAVRDTYHAQVFLCDPTNEARAAMASDKEKELGAVFVHPSNDPRVITGQGTIAIELFSQFKETQERNGRGKGVNARLDAVIVPLGGGGMISGMAVALKALDPRIKIFGAEPANAADAADAKAGGDAAWTGTSKHRASTVHTCADGLKTCIKDNNWPIIRDLVDEIITVSEEEIIDATELIYTRLKLAVEPSAGTGLAVALQPSFRARCFRNVGIVLCGGNTDTTPLFENLRQRFVQQPATAPEAKVKPSTPVVKPTIVRSGSLTGASASGAGSVRFGGISSPGKIRRMVTDSTHAAKKRIRRSK